MLTGTELGAAIAAALEQNGKTQADAARLFGVKAPSVSGWIKTGRISKSNFDRLRSWLVKTPPEHWGAISTPLMPSPNEAIDQANQQALGDLTVAEVTEVLLLYSKLNAIGRETVMHSLRLAAETFAAPATDHKRKRR